MKCVARSWSEAGCRCYIDAPCLAPALGQFDSAINDYTQANLRALSPFAFYSLGLAEEAKGDLTRAKTAYQAALQMAPNMQEARRQLESLP